VTERKATLKVLEDGTVDGELTVSFNGIEALKRRQDASDEDDEGRRKMALDELKGWLPAGATVELQGNINWEETAQPLRMVSHIHAPQLATVAGHRILVPAAAFSTNRTHPFQSDKRIHPIYFSYPWQETDDLTFELPAGARVEDLPKGRKGDEARVAWLSTEYESAPGKVHVHRHAVVEMIVLLPKYYSAIRTFFDEQRASDEERMVLQTGAPAAQK
jgi:hypothetical protein